MQQKILFPVLVLCLIGYVLWYRTHSGYSIMVEQIKAAIEKNHFPAASGKKPAHAPDLSLWKGGHAMDLIATQLSFGTRALDTPGHQKTIELIQAELKKAGLTAQLQEWDYTGPDGVKKPMTNIIARLNPANPERIIVGTHYDSIVRAYRDLDHPHAPMPGANNSASGVALLLETARMLSASKIAPAVGIDFVFFDGEEGAISLGAGDTNWVAIGSQYFASHLDSFYPTSLPRKSVIFDMVCYKDMKLYPEKLSADTTPAEVKKFWGIGHTIAPSIFLPQKTAWVLDDQNALLMAGIPSMLVIGIDYEPWFNTTQDTFDKCSATSLEAVGDTLVTYLFQ